MTRQRFLERGLHRMRDADDRRTGSAYLVRNGYCDHLREASSLFVLVLLSVIIEGLITPAAYGAARIGVGVTLGLGHSRFGMGQCQEFLEVWETTKGMTLGAKQTCTRGVDGENDEGTRCHIAPMVRPRECGKNQLRKLGAVADHPSSLWRMTRVVGGVWTVRRQPRAVSRVVSDSAVIVPNRLTTDLAREKMESRARPPSVFGFNNRQRGASVAFQERYTRSSCAFAREPSHGLACSWLVHILLERVSCMKPCVCVT